MDSGFEEVCGLEENGGEDAGCPAGEEVGFCVGFPLGCGEGACFGDGGVQGWGRHGGGGEGGFGWAGLGWLAGVVAAVGEFVQQRWWGDETRGRQTDRQTGRMRSKALFKKGGIDRPGGGQLHVIVVE